MLSVTLKTVLRVSNTTVYEFSFNSLLLHFCSCFDLNAKSLSFSTQSLLYGLELFCNASYLSQGLSLSMMAKISSCIQTIDSSLMLLIVACNVQIVKLTAILVVITILSQRLLTQLNVYKDDGKHLYPKS